MKSKLKPIALTLFLTLFFCQYAEAKKFWGNGDCGYRIEPSLDGDCVVKYKTTKWIFWIEITDEFEIPCDAGPGATQFCDTW